VTKTGPSCYSLTSHAQRKSFLATTDWGAEREAIPAAALGATAGGNAVGVRCAWLLGEEDRLELAQPGFLGNPEALNQLLHADHPREILGALSLTALPVRVPDCNLVDLLVAAPLTLTI